MRMVNWTLQYVLGGRPGLIRVRIASGLGIAHANLVKINLVRASLVERSRRAMSAMCRPLPCNARLG
jgi:hypothetical protein